MTLNRSYAGPKDMPATIPVFPLEGALLLPRGQLPLNIFEPRYVQMIDDAIRTHRIVGMIQPNVATGNRAKAPPLYDVGCAGRLTQFAETGDGRYVLSLSGIARFRVREELVVMTPYRQVEADFEPFAADFETDDGGGEVDRDGVLRTLREFAKSHGLEIDWKGIDEAHNDALVNALAMMSPFGPKEKQALLEAADLKTRAEVLIAITEIDLARGGGDASMLQ